MKFIKFTVVFFLSFFLINKSFSEINIDARYVILQDHYSGKILFEREADSKIYPASMTKIMTANFIR